MQQTKNGPSTNYARNSIIALCLVALLALVGCQSAGSGSGTVSSSSRSDTSFASVEDKSGAAESPSSSSASSSASAAAAKEGSEDAEKSEQESESESAAQANRVPVDINIVEDYREVFNHGYKGPEYQKYIVMHDTEGEGDPASVISYWEGNGNYVASHFIIGKDGTIYQCVPMDQIAHHAGFGDTGHNELYGVEDESRDDMRGTTPIGDWASDYGMNSYSIGIEMVHVGGSGYYTEEQLDAVDALIAYIDSYYGFESTIIDHKAWRSGNSDTSPEFAEYLANLQDHRTTR